MDVIRYFGVDRLIFELHAMCNQAVSCWIGSPIRNERVVASDPLGTNVGIHLNRVTGAIIRFD